MKYADSSKLTPKSIPAQRLIRKKEFPVLGTLHGTCGEEFIIDLMVLPPMERVTLQTLPSYTALNFSPELIYKVVESKEEIEKMILVAQVEG